MNDPTKASYFRDKKRKIDFVLIVENDITRKMDKYPILQEYLKNLKERGLQTEEEKGQFIENYSCIKIHAPAPTLDKYREESSNLDLSCDNMNFKKDKPYTIYKLKWFQNDLMNVQPEDALYQRAPKTFANEKPVDYTDAERILLVERMLSEIPFSPKVVDKGYKLLIKNGIIETAYPLHDSSTKWTDTDQPLTDRQILGKFWANLRIFYKQQPLNLIEKYFGSEVAFYFAWFGFYTTMLIPASILSILCVICAFFVYSLQKETIIQEVCESDKNMCPSICPLYSKCSMPPLKESCKTMKLSYALDNPATIVYSILMCFWGITFLACWRRKQAMLKLRWNLNETNVDNSIRPEFIKSAPVTRISSITGEIEYVYPRGKKVLGYFITAILYGIMIILYMLGIVIVMFIRLNILFYGKQSSNRLYKEYLSIFEAFVSSSLSTCVMSLLDYLKPAMARWLTNRQNPRTKVSYHQKYTTKIVIFSIADVFSPLFYLAYFKGHFYEHPGDASQWTLFGMFKNDVCAISGCLVDLAMQIFTLLFFKNIIRLTKETLNPILKVFYNKIFKTPIYNRGIESKQWERDFLLIEPKEEFLFDEYITNIIQCSFITFFIVALPIAPFLAFLNNVIELRLDAKRILTTYRRIIPKKVNGIEEWNTVVQLLTILGAISNPLLLAYSSSLIPKAIYFYRNNGSLKGYVNSTLSVFNLRDATLDTNSSQSTICHYYGKRHPPNHALKYHHTGDFWHELAIKTFFFAILENLCLLVSLLLNYIIPVVPRKVEIKILNDQRILRETKLQRSKSQGSLLRININGNTAGKS